MEKQEKDLAYDIDKYFELKKELEELESRVESFKSGIKSKMNDLGKTSFETSVCKVSLSSNTYTNVDMTKFRELVTDDEFMHVIKISDLKKAKELIAARHHKQCFTSTKGGQTLRLTAKK